MWETKPKIEPDVLVLAEVDRELLSTPAQPGQVLRVGSLPSCTFRLPEGAPVHALLKTYVSGLALLDLGHPSGTFHNGQRLEPHGKALIRSGDTVSFGGLPVRLQVAPPSPPRPSGEECEQDMLGGRFRTVRKLGGGGQAQVWEAIQLDLGRRVALKVIKHLDEEEDRRRLQREAKLLAQISHPHIVQVYDLFDSEDGLVIVMEHVAGASLDAALPARGMSLLRAVRIGQHVASALCALEQQGVLHRDIKPGNLLLGHDGRLRLIDFGIARTHDATQLTAPGMFIGSLSCAPPEQLDPDTELDHRADLYGLGATLYTLLTGEPPFRLQSHRARDLAAALYAIRELPPAPLLDRRHDCPGALQSLILTLLAKQPDERPPSAHYVEQALRHAELELLGQETRARV